ncbi:MAG: DUF58 domain-containing protein [Phycisphaerales bacterium]|nr:DUF58 domain-containing protein [Phycisphaerales bacterium]
MLVAPVTKPPRSLDDLLPPALAAKIDRLDVFSRKVFAGKLPGERRSKRRGRSVEFDDFRNYAIGDDLRHIDWNIYARFDRLVIKLFREEEDMGVHLIVDASASMGAGEESGRPDALSAASTSREGVPSKAVYAHQLAMALAYIGLVRNNRVSVSTVGGGTGVRRLLPVRGRTSLRRVSDFLVESVAGVGVRSSVPLGESVRDVVRRLSGRGIIVLVSDLLVPSATPNASLEGIDAIARSLALGGAGAGGAALDAYVLHTLAPSEIDPSRTPGLIGDLRLTDVESLVGVEMTITPASIARYRERVRGFIADAKETCRARGVAHFLVPTDTPIDRLLVDSLRRGGMLR